jgi:hypothetical protein
MQHMLSSFDQLVSNVNDLRKREGKRVLLKHQVEMIREQFEARQRGVRHFCVRTDGACDYADRNPS